MVPKKIPLLSLDVQRIAVGDKHNLVLSHGTVYSFGYNKYGQCGLTLKMTPDFINKTLHKVYTSKSDLGIYAGNSHSLIIDQEKAIGFGKSGEGQLGKVSQKYRWEPFRLEMPSSSFSSAFLGYNSTFLVTK